MQFESNRFLIIFHLLHIVFAVDVNWSGRCIWRWWLRCIGDFIGMWLCVSQSDTDTVIQQNHRQQYDTTEYKRISRENHSTIWIWPIFLASNSLTINRTNWMLEDTNNNNWTTANEQFFVVFSSRTLDSRSKILINLLVTLLCYCAVICEQRNIEISKFDFQKSIEFVFTNYTHVSWTTKIHQWIAEK